MLEPHDRPSAEGVAIVRAELHLSQDAKSVNTLWLTIRLACVAGISIGRSLRRFVNGL